MPTTMDTVVRGATDLLVQLEPTGFYADFWHFASERHVMYWLRRMGAQPPYTDDWVLATHRFTNPFRAADRVSQRLIRILYAESQAPDELLLRLLLFRMFNLESTWDHHVQQLGWPRVDSFAVWQYDQVLASRRAEGVPIYNNAYILPIPPGEGPKHLRHLKLIWTIVHSSVPSLLGRMTLRDATRVLAGYPSFGPFMSYQLAVDLNYSSLWGQDHESTFVQPGPGALRGLRKLFAKHNAVEPWRAIAAMCQVQQHEFLHRGLSPVRLEHTRPLQWIDMQNLLCEADKYFRATHPALKVGKTKIKQKYTADPRPMPAPFYPPKWGLTIYNYEVKA